MVIRGSSQLGAQPGFTLGGKPLGFQRCNVCLKVFSHFVYSTICRECAFFVLARLSRDCAEAQYPKGHKHRYAAQAITRTYAARAEKAHSPHLVLILLCAEVLNRLLRTCPAVPQFLQHSADHPVVQFLVLLVGPVRQGADERAGAGNVAFKTHIGNRLDQFQVVHEVVVGIHGDLLAVNLADGGAEGVPLLFGFQTDPLLHALDVPLVDLERFQCSALGVLVLPHLVRPQIFGIDADDHVDVVHHVLADGVGLIHVGVEHLGHDPLPVKAAGDLQVFQELGPVVRLYYIVKGYSLHGLEDIVGEHAAPFIGLRALGKKLQSLAETAVAEPLLAEALGDVRVLSQGVDHFGQRLDALFAGNFAGGQLHGFDRCQFFRAGNPGEYYPHRGGIIQVRVLVKRFTGQGRACLAADGVEGQTLLEEVVGVVGDVADPAAVDNRRLFFLCQEAVELGIVAGGNDQGVDRPPVAVDLDGPVLDDPQVDLYQVLLVLEDLVGKMDSAAADTREGATTQVETIGVVGVGDVQQTLDRLLSQQVNCRRGDFVLGRVLAGDRAETFGERDRDHFDEFQHPGQIAVAVGSDVVPDVTAAGPHGAVVFIQPDQSGFVKPALFEEIAPALLHAIQKVHGQDHRILEGLGVDRRYPAVLPQLIDTVVTESVAPVLLLCQERAVAAAEQLDEKGLAVPRFADEDEGHLLAGASFGSVLDKRDEAVDLIKHADGVLAAAPEYGEIVGGAAIYNHFFESCLQNHP